MPYIRFGLIVPSLRSGPVRSGLPLKDDPNLLMNLTSCTKTRTWLLLLRLRQAACLTCCFALPCYVPLFHGNEDVSRFKQGFLPHYVYKFNSYHIENTPPYPTNTNTLPAVYYFIFSVSAAQRGLWSPRSRSFLITRNDAPQLVELLWTNDQLVAETST
jgi:hypothetical protein